MWYLHIWYQTLQEPQQGPGNHYCGAQSQPHSVCAEIETQRGDGFCPLTIRLGVWWSVVSSPSGVQGKSPAENGFYAYFRSERSHLEHPFQYFWAMVGPPKCCGARENSPFPLLPSFLPLLTGLHYLFRKWTSQQSAVNTNWTERYKAMAACLQVLEISWNFIEAPGKFIVSKNMICQSLNQIWLRL